MLTNNKFKYKNQAILFIDFVHDEYLRILS